jgi:HTH-type transcriptional regulator/antitoxin HigA
MNIRPIKTTTDHQRALAELTALLDADPAPESPEAEHAEVLGTLIEDYESRHFPIEQPTPIEAIRFRMDQLGLKQKDLVPYIGSPSKVSEVLNGKRPLSLSMVRSLHGKLGIPAEVLIAEADCPDPLDMDEHEFPLKEMHRRGYFPGAPKSYRDFRKNTSKWLSRFLGRNGVKETAAGYARSTAHYRDTKSIKPAPFLAWKTRVLHESEDRPAADYRPGTVDESFLDELARLSIFNDAPLLAREFLEKHGIRIVIEPPLPATDLDGAALLRPDGIPVIGLTLRHDRLDNFWFTLMHELVHVGWHLRPGRDAFFDVLDAPSHTGDNRDHLEAEADKRAAEALIPTRAWRSAEARKNPSPELVHRFARDIQRHPAIVAGRIRRDAGNYRLLSRQVGSGGVRKLLLDQSRSG